MYTRQNILLYRQLARCSARVGVYTIKPRARDCSPSHASDNCSANNCARELCMRGACVFQQNHIYTSIYGICARSGHAKSTHKYIRSKRFQIDNSAHTTRTDAHLARAALKRLHGRKNKTETMLNAMKHIARTKHGLNIVCARVRSQYA